MDEMEPSIDTNLPSVTPKEPAKIAAPTPMPMPNANPEVQQGAKRQLMTVYDPLTRKSLTTTQDDAFQGLVTGQYTVPADETYGITKDNGELGGEAYTVQGRELVKALKGGYYLDTPENKAIRQYKEDNAGVLGGAKAFAASAANQALLGVPEVAGKLGIARWMPEFINKNTLTMDEWQALHEVNPGASFAGGTAGFIGSLFLGPAGVVARGAAATGQLGERALAKVIGATAAEQVGSRTATQAAKEIVAKMGGAAIEGATFMAPQAVTEAVLGDPEAAAESLMSGGLVGGAFGGATMLGGKLIKTGKNLLFSKPVESAAEAVTEIGLAGVNIATGVRPEIAKEAMELLKKDPDALVNAKTREDIFDTMTQTVKNYEDQYTKLQGSITSTKEALELAKKTNLQNLRQIEAPRDAAIKLNESMNQAKATLGDLSDQVEQVLENAGVTMRRQDVQSMLTKIQGSLKGDISDTAAAARKTLENYKQRLRTGYGDELTGGEVRQIMRSVRNDITSWERGAGAFNDVQNNAILSFTESLSSKLKGNPEYKTLMEQMAPISQTLREMTKVASTPEKALTFLNTVIKSTEKGKLKSELLDRWKNVSGTDLLPDLEAVKNAKKILEASKTQDVTELLAKNEYLAHLEAVKKFQEYENVYNKFSRISSGRIQSVVNNQVGTRPNILDQKAIKELSSVTGVDFEAMLRHTKVAEAFEKETTAGSRKALTYGAAGAGFGGAIAGVPGAVAGGAIGAFVGAASDKYGTQWVRHALEVIETANKQVAHTTEKLQSLKPWVQDLRKSGKARGAAVMPLQKFFDEHRKENDDQALESIQKQAAVYVSNPAVLQQKIKEYTQPLIDANAPKVAEQLEIALQRSVNYVYQNMPKELLATSPFAPKIKMKPNPSEMAQFKNKLEVLRDPWTVLDHVADNTLSPAHVHSLAANYPSLYNYMKIHIEHAAATSPVPLDYQKRIMLGTLFGSALDSSLTPSKLLDLQTSFIAPEDGSREKQAEIDIASQAILKTDKFQQA